MDEKGFALEIEEWARQAGHWAAEECAKKTRQVFKQVVWNSPQLGFGRYAKGHFIRNWIPSAAPYMGGELAGETSAVQKEAQIDAVINDEFFKANVTAYFTNSTEYCKQIEEDGWTRKDGSPGHPPYAPVAYAIAQTME